MENSFFFPPSDSEEIVNLIHRQKNKSTELMNIPVFIYLKFSLTNFSYCFKTL